MFNSMKNTNSTVNSLYVWIGNQIRDIEKDNNVTDITYGYRKALEDTLVKLRQFESE